MSKKTNKKNKKTKLTTEDWDDVADLLEQQAWGVENGYENHTPAARDKAAEWIRGMVMRAHDKARDVEAVGIADGIDRMGEE